MTRTMAAWTACFQRIIAQKVAARPKTTMTARKSMALRRLPGGARPPRPPLPLRLLAQARLLRALADDRQVRPAPPVREEAESVQEDVRPLVRDQPAEEDQVAFPRLFGQEPEEVVPVGVRNDERGGLQVVR